MPDRVWRAAGRALEDLRVVVAVFLAMGLAVLIMDIIDNRSDEQQLIDLAEQLAVIAEQNLENGEIVKDCVTPGGECFERSQDTTREAVSGINAVTIFAVICNDLHGTNEDKVFECVEEKFIQYQRENRAG